MSNVSFKSVSELNQIVEKIFESEKVKLAQLLPFAEIVHIGSTAVPGSLTKGDLDINVRVNKNHFFETVQALKKMYGIAQYHNWTQDFASFKDDNSYELPVGIQVSVIEGTEDYFC